MSQLTRRQFNTLGLAAGTAMTLSGAPLLRAQAKPKVVVIGGGAGGATAARYIAKDSDGAIDVTLIEDSDSFTTCFFSNLYLGDFRDFGSITHSYDKLVNEYGINKITAMATEIDRDGKSVKLSNGEAVPYDLLVVSPGIDLIYDSVPGYSEAAAQIAPHAWQAGPQTQLLKEKLDAIQDGEQVLMVAPPNPFRCPPGPYERVSMMAHLFKTKGYKDAHIIIIDHKPKFSKQGLFMEGWEKHYPGMIEWIGSDMHGGIKGVDVDAGTVETDIDTFSGALLNIIPAQRAGAIALSAGLGNDSGWCPVDPDSMRSTVDDSIFVIGDASIAGAMPKSGFSANNQAKIAAMNVRAELTGSKAFPAKYANTCWSLIDTDDGIKVGARYAPTDGKIASTSSFISQTGEDAELRKATYEESLGWYASITEDMFG